MEVEQRNFATHLIITVIIIIQYNNNIIDYLKTSLLKFGQIGLKRLRLIIVSCVQVYRQI